MSRRPGSAVHDPRRLAALEGTRLLDAAREETFDRLTRLASRMLGTPCSVLSLVDADRQFFLSECGMAEDVAAARETPLSHSFCRHVVDQAAPLIVTDAREDPLVAGNLGVEELDVVAYAGVPLRLSDGHVLGAFCAIEPDPRAWSAGDVELLEDLATLAVEAIELRQERAAATALPPATPAEGHPPLALVPDPDDEPDPRLDALLAALPGAAGRGELHLTYAPLVHLASGEVWGFTALAAWHPPRQEPVAPEELRALAEHDGESVALGEAVLRRACADLAAWREAGGAADAHLGLAMPVSAAQLGTLTFADRVGAILRVAGLPHRALTLLVDEHALLGARPVHRATIAGLRTLGVAIALRGAGTGAATLAQLAAFPADVAVLDAGLVAALDADAEAERLAGAVVAAAERLGLGTVGTGVATRAHAERLAGLGCVTGQGPHFAAPLEAGAVGSWLRSAHR
jgi:EAL domain-containing protein (putative c-di-GMP-specific phosphodiesterase class I)